MEAVFGVVYSFILGAIVASFVNVVALRHGSGRTLMGRSKCMVCDTTLVWYDLVPVVSFIMLRARCRSCKSRLSFRYPIVECLLGLIFALIALRVGVSLDTAVFIVFQWVVWSVFVAIVLYDLQHKIIPDRFVVVLGILTFLFATVRFIVAPAGVSTTTLLFDTFAAGPIIALPFAIIWLVSGGRWMGLGDAKLAFSIGWLLGLSGGTASVLLSFWIGAFAGIGLILIPIVVNNLHRRRLPLRSPQLTMKSEIPFAPFLALGALLVFLFDINLTVLFELLAFR